jgi:hypothetical protein
VPETRWGLLQKSDTDNETIEEAILRLIAGSGVFGANSAWGNLPKSQVDDETVEGAIDRLVQAHDDDENAHIEVGQSLQSHKASEIIDHAARSIVTDKLYKDRFILDTHFAGIDGWQKTAGVACPMVGEVDIVTTAVNGNTQIFNTQNPDIDQDPVATDRHPYWLTSLKISQNTSQEIYLGQIIDNAGGGYGFKIVNGTIYTVWMDGDEVEHTDSMGALAVDTFYILGGEIDTDDIIHWYINGSEVKTMAKGNLWGTITWLAYRIKTTASASKAMHVKDAHYEQDY